MKSKNCHPLIIVCQLWMLVQGTSLASSFIHELQNLTIIYKPGAYIYHFCQIAPSIPPKRIRWHYETFHHSSHETLAHCKDLWNNSDCFDFYYGPSLSLLVVKEPDLFPGKYTCHVNINSTYELNSTGWMDVKSPSSDYIENEESTTMANASDLETLATDYDVPLITDETQFTSFGQRMQTGGIFHTTCQSVQSSYPISFVWLQLRNSSKGMKTVRFVHDDGRRVRIKTDNHSSSLTIYSVGFGDHGDYVCIASNVLGRSYSSTRSLIVSERMVSPRIHDNLGNDSYFDLQHNDIKSLTCAAEGHPLPDVAWLRVSDFIPLVRGQSYAVLRFATKMHGVHKYMCEAQNKHGLARIFVNVIIPDVHIQPVLNYSDLQSRSVRLTWRVPNERDDRFNHFIIYYRALHHFDGDLILENGSVDNENYRQVFVDPFETDYNHTFQVNDLIPFTSYEFRLKGFTGAVPSNYSNAIFIRTREAVPPKVEQLHGYVWNKTSVFVHWAPPNSTNGPNFYYILYYTINTSIPFDQWPSVRLRTYPFCTLPVAIPPNVQLFIRVASVNAKGLTLSDFHMINHSLSNESSLPSIKNFHCVFDDRNQSLSLRWSCDSRTHSSIQAYVLYYSDFTRTNDDLIRTLVIPIGSVSRPSSDDVCEYKFNASLLNLNYHKYHIVRLRLAIVDQDGNQLPVPSSAIYATLTGKSGRCYISYLVFISASAEISMYVSLFRIHES